jgi:hypothetical protein
VDPFLDLAAFQALWDGPPLTPKQRAQVTLWVQVASEWIYRNGPQGNALAVDDATAQFVVYDVVSNAVRYQRYSKLSTFNKTTAHRIDSGTFSDPMTALEFTDNHKSMLQIPARSVPMSSFRADDFGTPGLGFGGSFDGYGNPGYVGGDRGGDIWPPSGNVGG